MSKQCLIKRLKSFLINYADVIVDGIWRLVLLAAFTVMAFFFFRVIGWELDWDVYSAFVIGYTLGGVKK